MGWVSGDPDQEFGGVRVGDVALVLRHLGRPEPILRSVTNVQSRWMVVTGQLPGPRLTQVTRIVTGLTHQRQRVWIGERGWVIDLGHLEQSWPRLPWTE